MPIDNYGVLKCKPVRTHLERKKESPHFQILGVDSNNINYRISVNVESAVQPSALLYLSVSEFQHPITGTFPKQTGYTLIKGNEGLDYIRDQLVRSCDMTELPHHVDGANNDLLEALDIHIKGAIKNKAYLYVFGSRFSGSERDRVFHFSPSQGMHNVHMNQGNAQKYRSDDGTYQDGALFIYYPNYNTYTAIFLAFQSQSWCTDDKGHAKDR